MELDRTCWRGVTIEHPAQWELSRFSGPQEQGRCVFSDRLYQRLDVRWRPLKYVPNLDLMLQQHRKREDKDDDVQLLDLTGAPDSWRGVVRKSEQATIVHAGRFFRRKRLLVEAAITWPVRREHDLENAILSGIQLQPPDTNGRLWQAMGLSVTVPKPYDLREVSTKVGLVQWTFLTGAKQGPKLVIERFAMPQDWLGGTVRDWLARDLPQNHKIAGQDMLLINSHRGQQLISSGKVGIVSSFRGFKELRIAVAWICPLEDRLYRISLSEVTRKNELSLPKQVRVHCCRPLRATRQLSRDE